MWENLPSREFPILVSLNNPYPPRQEMSFFLSFFFKCKLNIFLWLAPLFILDWLFNLQCPEQVWCLPWATRGGIWLWIASPSVMDWARKIQTGREGVFFLPLPLGSAASRENWKWPMSSEVNIGPQSWRPPDCRAQRACTPLGCLLNASWHASPSLSAKLYSCLLAFPAAHVDALCSSPAPQP